MLGSGYSRLKAEPLSQSKDKSTENLCSMLLLPPFILLRSQLSALFILIIRFIILFINTRSCIIRPYLPTLATP
jgi:hypothetical protein